ncbi:CBS domain-containing protein [Saccharopolyspora lacisalsi]|uniref:CBS domain-containing protein n=1 Tax=Halosaccharopolyspora lacisalsi TaxID=1000566 RepID=A0A839DZZ9_9PSEU|nr:CBS domain-containing protein [Halosaccharopolyspora lacisalsi]MBA8824995.1 CBS domain-containing protein [Halosaccharopolyspora lacisalsi]
MTSVREIMTSGVECIEDDASLTDAAYRMSRLGLGAVPICDAGNRLRGIITERDIVVKCLAGGADPSHARAGQCAEGTPIAVQADDSVAEAARMMGEHHIRRLVVVDGSDVVGMISESNLVRGLPGDQYAEMMRSILDAPPSVVQPLSSRTPRSGAEGIFAHFMGRLHELRRRGGGTSSTSARSGKD